MGTLLDVSMWYHIRMSRWPRYIATKKASPGYLVYNSMKNRCYNTKNPRFKDYGGRGIKICARWLSSFDNFMDDMGNPPFGLSIDRQDNNGDYSPENCRWATRKEQQGNTRAVIVVVVNGKSMRLIDLEPDQRTRATIQARLKTLGWPMENALSGKRPHRIIPLKTRPEKLTVKPVDIKAFVSIKRREGLTLQDIGSLLGLTRQRVHQILKVIPFGAYGDSALCGDWTPVATEQR